MTCVSRRVTLVGMKTLDSVLGSLDHSCSAVIDENVGAQREVQQHLARRRERLEVASRVLAGVIGSDSAMSSVFAQTDKGEGAEDIAAKTALRMADALIAEVDK